MRHTYPMLMLACLALTAGCTPYVTVSGIVVDSKGETLPGVGVVVRGTDIQAVTNGVGRYTLHLPPGVVTLEMVKTGYTPAVLSLDAVASGPQADNVLMWPLPPRKGLFLYEGHRYRECTQADPRQYLRIEKKGDKETVLDSTPLFATKRTPDIRTPSNFYEMGALGETAMLVAHKLPAYDVELHRLELTKAAIYVPRANRGARISDDDLPRDTVWAPAESVPLTAVPVDQPGRMLLDLRPLYPLAPGIYAAHWGAFAGYDSIDGRIFLFEVFDPAVQGEVEEEAGEEADADGGTQ